MTTNTPLLLAVESATSTLSVALMRGGDLLSEQAGESGTHHAETLLPVIGEVLAAAGCTEREVEAFGVSIGPGSFTCLRVGLATVKGLAFGTKRQAIAVPTLAALAWQYADAHRGRDPDEAIVALLDARRGDLYAAIFDAPAATDTLRQIGKTELVTPEVLCGHLPSRCVLIGEGTAIFEDAGSSLAAGVRCAQEEALTPSARAVGALAVRALARGEGRDPAELVPHYVRRAEAEVTRTSIPVEDAPG